MSIDVQTKGIKDAVDGLVKKASRITLAESEALSDAWEGDRLEARDAAHGAAQGAAEEGGRIGACVAAGDAVQDAVNAALDDAWAGAGFAAMLGAMDAVQAVVVRDLISDEDFRVLVGPWESVMGRIS